MKKLIFFSSFYVFAIISCNNSSGSDKSPAASSDDNKSKPASTTSLGGDKGIINCTIDGQQKTFHVAQPFFEISLGTDPNNSAKDGLEILDGNAKKEGFEFEFKKSGTTKIKTDATGDINCIINYYNPQGITYTGEDVTITVMSYDQNHLTGTFSGKLVNAYYDEQANAKKYPQYMQITDGKFDLNK